MRYKVFDETSITFGGVSAWGLTKGHSAIEKLMRSIRKEFVQNGEILEWLNINTPGWALEQRVVLEDSDNGEVSYHYLVRFEKPADAFAFKLRWL